MSQCKHTNLVLLPTTAQRLRCRRCHLTIKAEELEDRYCPECLETTGKRVDDFETISSEHRTRYRCEQCGAVIDYRIQEEFK